MIEINSKYKVDEIAMEYILCFVEDGDGDGPLDNDAAIACCLIC